MRFNENERRYVWYPSLVTGYQTVSACNSFKHVTSIIAELTSVSWCALVEGIASSDGVEYNGSV